MHACQEPYRRLCEEILEGATPVYESSLLPWLKSSGELERSWLRDLAIVSQSPPWPTVEVEALWRLYALSRVNQILLLPFQNGTADGSNWDGPDISEAQYSEFFGSLGLKEAVHTEFHPFFHEIVEVNEVDDEAQRPRLVDAHWPCLMLGNMMFSRAGCTVSAGPQWLKKDVAESSTLYWAFRRKNRPYEDLSHGWGSNSQWRTSFRRDYRSGEHFFFNVDGKTDIEAVEGTDENGLSPEERGELLRHRCLVTHTRPDENDLWVYDYRYVEPTSLTPLSPSPRS